MKARYLRYFFCAHMFCWRRFSGSRRTGLGFSAPLIVPPVAWPAAAGGGGPPPATIVDSACFHLALHRQYVSSSVVDERKMDHRSGPGWRSGAGEPGSETLYPVAHVSHAGRTFTIPSYKGPVAPNSLRAFSLPVRVIRKPPPLPLLSEDSKPRLPNRIRVPPFPCFLPL